MPSQPETSPPPFVLGFGAHPTTHEYMLVCILFEKADIEQGKFPSKVELYTQGTGSWRSIASVGHPHFDCVQAFVNGAIHWIAFDGRVVLFNMGSLAFSQMMMPAALASESPLCLSIMSYGESLAVLCYGQPEDGSCGMWVMKEYGVAESWAKLYNINHPGVLHQIAGFWKNGEVLLLMSDNYKRLLCYDLLGVTGFAQRRGGVVGLGGEVRAVSGWFTLECFLVWPNGVRGSHLAWLFGRCPGLCCLALMLVVVVLECWSLAVWLWAADWWWG
ncbi:hypothetical protein RHMOL_Rhmol04G0094000 [Rhododendron molle]|uniref:Uncharacterized protein n=1 Tax=Rhododendron molle TaxID=49168 RepID=A0ACC0NYI7_RHOML|nr:hypothetical protein RHMOL_Rhmol04G0094000 [Rhododendron molle]